MKHLIEAAYELLYVIYAEFNVVGLCVLMVMCFGLYVMYRGIVWLIHRKRTNFFDELDEQHERREQLQKRAAENEKLLNSVREENHPDYVRQALWFEKPFTPFNLIVENPHIIEERDISHDAKGVFEKPIEQLERRLREPMRPDKPSNSDCKTGKCKSRRPILGGTPEQWKDLEDKMRLGMYDKPSSMSANVIIADLTSQDNDKQEQYLPKPHYSDPNTDSNITKIGSYNTLHDDSDDILRAETAANQKIFSSEDFGGGGGAGANYDSPSPSDTDNRDTGYSTPNESNMGGND